MLSAFKIRWVDRKEGRLMIEVKNIYKSFGTLDVLKDVSLTVNKGEVVVIIGPSGSGKSTLLRCINHLETPDKGEIVVDGEILTGKSGQIRKVRANLGMVFQQFNLFPHMNVYDNITLGPKRVQSMSKEDMDKTVDDLLAKVGLSDKKFSYPPSTVGRPAATDCHSQGTGHESGIHAIRRAHFRPGSGADWRSTGSHAPACKRRYDNDYRDS